MTSTLSASAIALGILVSGCGGNSSPPTAPSCAYAISPSTQSFGASGGTGSVTVTASPSACSGSWTATSNDSWITITSGSSGTGSGTVAYSVASTTSGSSRSGTLTIAGKAFTVVQAGVDVSMMSAKIDGATWNAVTIQTGPLPPGGATTITGGGFITGSTVAWVIVLTEASVPGITGPGTYTTSSVLFSLAVTGQSWTAVFELGTGTVTFTTLTASRATGTFSFTGVVTIPGRGDPVTKVVTDGVFDVINPPIRR